MIFNGKTLDNVHTYNISIILVVFLVKFRSQYSIWTVYRVKRDSFEDPFFSLQFLFLKNIVFHYDESIVVGMVRFCFQFNVRKFSSTYDRLQQGFMCLAF